MSGSLLGCYLTKTAALTSVEKADQETEIMCWSYELLAR